MSNRDTIQDGTFVVYIRWLIVQVFLYFITFTTFAHKGKSGKKYCLVKAPVRLSSFVFAFAGLHYLRSIR